MMKLTIIMRRYMMRIAEHFAKKTAVSGFLSPVRASVRWQARHCRVFAATNEVCTLPVYRPVIGFDKEEKRSDF